MISELNKSDLKKIFTRAFIQCRTKTLSLFETMDEATFCCQPHHDFSPVGWHLGHIVYTESLWILERSARLPCMFPQYRKLFAADGLPKSERVKLPNLEEIRYYLDTVRDKVLNYLEIADLEAEESLWRFLLQHESQHSEIICFVLEMCKRQQSSIKQFPYTPTLLYPCTPPVEMIQIPSGEFEMGNDSPDALDNERPAHRVYLDTYLIDRYPVTCADYQVFMEAGGYNNPQWWSKAGWEWLQTQKVMQPLYWCDNPAFDSHPVCGVSWYEAQAYSRFVGKRLPTEAEWEKAVVWDAKANHRRTYPWGDEEPKPKYCNHDTEIGKTTSVDAYSSGQSAYGLYDTLGNVWEWTATWFDGYEGFQYYPYIGYSQVYFDHQHRVLKGGSWATRPWALRGSFRNWYHPGVRQILAGFRCAKNGE
ncbi:ergothioneine biosynthesis protein EgtB [Chlorogloeopsis sp. ULAP01]|uniref:ergothioneine biosynthesis protein EgtB n=1 Tax=Chlorogloeopsis sp. ULAP01 TaxID=3056483 RepID=UPI0025AA3663|nr:ergothioneine biosynthesis protein EgtB [Chlorogloeopsis sp. ULAP01]MDM9379790.1 ergothioneine biosynthesis protein EgtB [Chlorogloeopsis sp. ULAP01]